MYKNEKDEIVKRQIEENSIDKKHNVVFMENSNTYDDIEYYGLKVRSMGRGYDEDSEFFDSASTAAYYITEKIK